MVGSVVKDLPANAGDLRDGGFDSWVRKIPWRRKWQPTPVFLPAKTQGQRSMGAYSPWDCKDSDTTEQLNNKNKVFLLLQTAMAAVFQRLEQYW